jgi:hypothetical protein
MPRQRVNRVRDEDQSPVTTRAIFLFKRASMLEGTMDACERDLREWHLIAVELHREFGLKPWDTNILDVQIDDDPPEAFLRDEMRLQSWLKAKRLRMQLISLI